MKARIVVCASGEGSNFESVVQATRKGSLSADVVGLLCNRPTAPVLDRARQLGTPFKVLAPKSFATREVWDETMAITLAEWRPDWVVLAGFLVLIGPQVLTRFASRIVNSHPALLPAFGGAGMYGEKVHAAVLQAGASQTGITVHLVDGAYDHGKVLAQAIVPVLAGDSVEALAARVKATELKFYPKVLEDLVTGRITTS